MKLYRYWDLAGRINAALFLLMLLAGIGVGGYLYWAASRLLSEEINRSAQAAVTAEAERINRHFPVIEAAAQGLALSLERMNSSEEIQLELLKESLGHLQKQVPFLSGISIAFIPGKAPNPQTPMLHAYFNPSGTPVSIRLENSQYPYLQSDWFTIPKLLDRPIWTEPFQSARTGVLLCTRSQPIRNAQGEFIGIVGFNLSLENLNAEIIRADAYGYGQEFLISRFGRFIAFPEDSSRTRQLRDEAAALSQSTIFSYADLLQEKSFSAQDASERLRHLGRAMLDGKSGTMRARIFNRESGMEQIFYAPLPNPGWSLGIAYSESRLMAPLHNLVKRVVPVVGALSLIFLLGAWVLVRRMTNPLVKLTDAALAIGEGNFNTPLPEVKSRDQIGQLTSAFGEMQKALTSYMGKLESSTASRERIEKELEVARKIQQGILPKFSPDSTCGITFFAKLRPVHRVGGDLYDFFLLDDSHCCFIIGDVAGGGISAALQMSIIQTLQRGEAQKSFDSGEIVSNINNFLTTDSEIRPFVGYLFGILNTDTGEAQYTNAGHQPPCIRRTDGALERLTAQHGPAVGLTPKVRYHSGSFVLQKGDTLVLYSDGLTGICNPSGEVFGSDALMRLIAYRPESSPEELGEEILDAVDRFGKEQEQEDDIALLIFRFDKQDTKNNSTNV